MQGAFRINEKNNNNVLNQMDGGPGVEVSTAAVHAIVRGSFPGLGGLKETQMFLPNPLEKTR